MGIEQIRAIKSGRDRADREEAKKEKQNAKSRQPKQEPMKPLSQKRARQEGKYNRISKKLKQENPECEAKLEGCQFHTMHIHHTAGRIAEKLLDVEDFLYVCDNCHRIIESQPQLAKELGLSKSRLAIKTA